MVRVITVALALGLATPALAYHTDEERLTDRTADTLRSLEFQLGVWTLEAGVTDDLMLGTWTYPWLVRMPNVTAKYRFWHGDQLSLSGSLMLARLDFSNFDESVPAKLTIIPMGLNATWRADEHSFSGGLLYTLIRVSGESPSSDKLEGAAAVTNTQLTATWEWRLSKYAAFVTDVRVQLFQLLSVSGVTVIPVNDRVSWEVVGAAESDAIDVENIWSVVPSFLWSYKHLNLRLGLGWGNFNLSPMNVAIPVKFVVPEADLFVRF